ncbi:MAG: DUF6079 family protein [Pyrinomonadaceae bacterium]
MNRIQEKVKDLIEVRKYEHLHDFLAEPSKTLEGYHYTPVTSNLMVNWLDALAAVDKGKGTAKALAGYRGVGKSHFLAALGAMLSQPELRSKVRDEHVFASLHHLKRRHYPVAYVRRGTKKTFTEELITAISQTLGADASKTDSNIESLIQTAADSARELPFVILIDTDGERESRVARDDGHLLGELAEIGKNKNVFIGVALDDDITDADGVNSAIAQTFTIDYLDQEHLYQIVDAHIFPKHRQSQVLIQKLYNEFRDTLPNFRWSEQRFNALYPLHPSILEVAPFVRFYAPSFALLGFASRAGERILGRPANSLISLDEVFDNVETSLRKAPNLEESFAVYDKILDQVISEIPVMQRLQSKLVLKAMFILSLDGNGTTAGEISEAMLIYDENDPQKSIDETKELLQKFADVFPDDVWVKDDGINETHFGIRVSGKDDLNSALEEASRNISLDVVPQILRRLAKDKFFDWKLFSEVEAETSDTMESVFVWRGGLRNAKLNWNWNGDFPSDSQQTGQTSKFDAEIFINGWNVAAPEAREIGGKCGVSWNTAKLTGDEIATLQRLYILLNDSSLKEQYAEQVRSAGHTHMVSAGKILDRVLFLDASLYANGEKLPIPLDILEKTSVSEVISGALSAYFDAQYPEHPVFEKQFGMNEVSALVNDLFSGAKRNIPQTQELAEVFALPLGLVKETGNEFVSLDEDEIEELPVLKDVLSFIDGNEDETISLSDIYSILGDRPLGLVTEAQRLILGFLVSQRRIEFVTSKGDRINHRSLDLKIVWDDIVGVARPSGAHFDYSMLTDWARAITKNEKIEVFNAVNGREGVIEALSGWVDKWEQIGALDKFNKLPDDILNTRIWQVSVRVEKSFGAVAKTIRSIAEGSVTLEDGLQRVAETFFDSAEELFARTDDLRKLEDFIEGASKRKQIWSYLAVCESTQDESIENFRSNLLRLIDESYNLPSFESNQQMQDTWEVFREKYSEHFAIRHNAIMNSQQLRQEFDAILKGDEWWEFECLSKLPIFRNTHWQKAEKILKRFRALECNFDVRENLKSHPFCACSFSLQKMSELAKLSHSLLQTIAIGRKSYRKTLFMISNFVSTLVNEVLENDKDQVLKKEAENLIRNLKDENSEAFTSAQLSILYSAMYMLPSSTSIDVAFPSDGGLFTSDELRSRINVWLDDLPNEPILLKF